MKNPVFAKVLGLLLVTTLLAVHTAVAADDIWCLGSDGHLAIKSTSGDHCCEEIFRSKGRSGQGYAVNPAQDACGSCLDLRRDKIEASLLKRHGKIFSPALNPAPAGNRNWSLPQDPRVGLDMATSEKRVSQALRWHRTVVLLN